MQSNLIRLCGLAAMLGGALLVLGAVITAAMPRGCIAEECAVRPMRDTSGLAPISILSALLVAAGLAGMVVLVRHAGRFGRLGRASLIVIAIGAALLVIGTVLNAWDSSLVPAFIIPGILVLISGVLLLAIAVLRSRVLPRWAAVLLIVGALAMLGFNDQNWQALMAIPFGIAWVGVGYALWSSRSFSTPAGGRRVT